MNVNQENSKAYWNNIHTEYNREDIEFDDWLEKFDEIIENADLPIIDLGCGSGNDTLYLINKNKKVISCDLSENAISNIKKNFPEILDAKVVNMLDGLPFDDNSADLIIADLSLHYFNKNDTIYIINEIKRVLSNNGHLIFRVNSINDVNHGAGKGKEVEKNLFLTNDNRLKRFFDIEDINYFFGSFEIEYIKEEIMTRYELEKRLYRGCVKNIK